jgi:hypothetical protein
VAFFDVCEHVVAKRRQEVLPDPACLLGNFSLATADSYQPIFGDDGQGVRLLFLGRQALLDTAHDLHRGSAGVIDRHVLGAAERVPLLPTAGLARDGDE